MRWIKRIFGHQRQHVLLSMLCQHGESVSVVYTLGDTARGYGCPFCRISIVLSTVPGDGDKDGDKGT